MKRSKAIKSSILLLAVLAISASQLFSLIVPALAAVHTTDTTTKKSLTPSDLVNQYIVTTNWLSGNVMGAIPTVYTTASEQPKAAKKESSDSKATKTTANKPASQAGTTVVSAVAKEAATTAQATPTTAPTTKPHDGVATNLVANGSFETTHSGLAEGWVATSAFGFDTMSHGNDGENSLFLSSTGTGEYAYTNMIEIDDKTTYMWMQYVYTIVAGEEFGFYIDEYDENGNWVSGQWKGRLDPQDAGTAVVRRFFYTASSDNVARVRLQYYSNAGDQTVAYIDSVYFGK